MWCDKAAMKGRNYGFAYHNPTTPHTQDIGLPEFFLQTDLV